MLLFDAHTNEIGIFIRRSTVHAPLFNTVVASAIGPIILFLIGMIPTISPWTCGKTCPKLRTYVRGTLGSIESAALLEKLPGGPSKKTRDEPTDTSGVTILFTKGISDFRHGLLANLETCAHIFL